MGEDASTLEARARAALVRGDLPAARVDAQAACAALPSARTFGTLGLVLKRAGELAPAIAAYRAGLAHDPHDAALLVNLARALREQGELAGALAAFRAAVRERPEFAEAWSMLSNAEREAGDGERALAAARRAQAIKPELREAHLNEAAALCVLGRFDEACASALCASGGETSDLLTRTMRSARAAHAPTCALVEEALRDPHALRALGRHLLQKARHACALACFELLDARTGTLAPELVDAALALGLAQRALQRGLPRIADADPVLVGALGRAFIQLERPADALPLLERAQAARPRDAAIAHNLGAALQHLGRPIQATVHYRRALELAPELVDTRLNLGIALAEQAEHGEAVRVLREALARAPQRAELHSNLLFAMHFDASLDAVQIYAEHRRFAARFETPVAAPARAAREGRALRVGYVSPDLRAHPVASFLTPVLAHHDPRVVEVICYSDTARPDATTERITRLVSRLRHTHALSDDALCAQIRADGVDILVDLAGHTSHNRMPVFAKRAAPLQLSWIGYFDTTGLSNIDVRLIDAASLPAHGAQRFSERLVHLPRTANCYEPPEVAGEVAPAPCLAQGFVTFGCFNNPAKITRAVAHTFADVLCAVPDSKIILKYGAFDDRDVRARYLGWFAERGVTEERIVFEGHSSLRDFFASFARVDIALDPFPYSGETTALHTLWMGVPVIALEGDTLVQRLASRVLRVAGFTELVVRSTEEYVARAVHLAGARDALAALRAQLRPRLAASPLLDHVGFTRELERTLCALWDEPSTPP